MKHLSKLVWLMAFAMVIALGASSPASAQDKPGIFGGYQFINNSTASVSVPAGWFAGVQVPIGVPMFSVVGVVDGGYKSDSTTIPLVGTVDTSTKTHTVLGGVVYNLKEVNGIVPEAHVAVGVAHSSVDSTSGGVTTSGSSNDGVVDIGGGIGKKLNDKWSLLVDIGFRRVMSTVGQNEFRLSAGLSMPLGK